MKRDFSPSISAMNQGSPTAKIEAFANRMERLHQTPIKSEGYTKLHFTPVKTETYSNSYVKHEVNSPFVKQENLHSPVATRTLQSTPIRQSPATLKVPRPESAIGSLAALPPGDDALADIVLQVRVIRSCCCSDK